MLERKPMPRDSCCINILTLATYLKSQMPNISYDQLLNGVVGNPKFSVYNNLSGELLPVTREYLLDPSNWVSNEVIKIIYSNGVSILNDPETTYRAGRAISKTIVGGRLFLMRLVGPRTIISRLPVENAKFNRNKTIEIVKNLKGYAIVRLHWNQDQAINKHFCQFNRGVYEGLASLVGAWANVEETTCQFEGGDYCEFHIRLG